MSQNQNPDAAHFRIATDEQILSECRREMSRGSGPGGQKRNKTSNAVCLVHIPTGLSVRAQETRSQNSNLKLALSRLRFLMVLEFRIALDEHFQIPDWLVQNRSHGKLRIGPKSADYLKVIGTLLDMLAHHRWSLSQAAQAMGISTGNLASLLKNDEKLMAFVNARRRAIGLKVLGD